MKLFHFHKWRWPEGCTPLRVCLRICVRCGKREHVHVDIPGSER